MKKKQSVYIDKGQVRARTNYLIKTGAIKRAPCFICGKEPAEAHHTDYLDPTHIIFLCVKHHKNAHKTLKISELPKMPAHIKTYFQKK